MDIKTTPTADDDFATAFGELTGDGTAPTAKPEPSTPAAPAPAATITEADPSAAAPAAPADEGAPNAEAPAPEALEPAAAPVAATPPAPAAPADPFALIATLQAEVAALKAAPAPAPAPAPAAPEPVAPLYSTDEETVLAKYREDWPDIVRGEALIRRQELVQLASYIFSQVEARVAPIEATAISSQGHTQYSQIVSLVPDYDAVRDQTLAWIQDQPAFLRDAYQKVADEGSAEDVAHLIGVFKKDTGYVAPAAVAPAPAAPAPTAAPVAPTVSAAAQAAAKALKPVVSGRSEPTNAADPNDYEAAFAEFSKT